jgi:hypothetical protein
LQWLLTHSFSGKALAVKRVTENKGKNTPGVDKVIWKTPGTKTNAIASLKRRGYSALPLRRVMILKKNGKMRPLGIPVMRCRAMQALHLLALEPVAETTADPNSYGFRPEQPPKSRPGPPPPPASRCGLAHWHLESDRDRPKGHGRPKAPRTTFQTLQSPRARSLEKPECAVNKWWSDKTWTGISVVCNLRRSESTNGLCHASRHGFPIHLVSTGGLTPPVSFRPTCSNRSPRRRAVAHRSNRDQTERYPRASLPVANQRRSRPA